jgi:Uma2 family endonuclease
MWALAASSGPRCRWPSAATAGRDSDPEPDLALVAGDWRDYAAAHPTTALLVVEIADSLLAHDRTRKARAYARAGVADYWIVNLVEWQVEVYRRPEPDPSEVDAWHYGVWHIARPGEHLSPLAAPGASIAVQEVLP